MDTEIYSNKSQWNNAMQCCKPQFIGTDTWKFLGPCIFYLFYILLASPTGRDTATACANYCGRGTRSQFCEGMKPECPEKTLEVRLRLTETQSTYNIEVRWRRGDVELEGMIDVHYASLTSRWVQHRVFCLDGHPSRYQPRPTGINFGEQTGNGVFPLVISVPHYGYHQMKATVQRTELGNPIVTRQSVSYLQG